MFMVLVWGYVVIGMLNIFVFGWLAKTGCFPRWFNTGLLSARFTVAFWPVTLPLALAWWFLNRGHGESAGPGSLRCGPEGPGL